MKNIILLLVLSVSISCNKTEEKVIIEERPSFPQVEFEYYEYDLGDIIAGPQIIIKFPYKNIGDKPFKFGRSYSECGGITSRYSNNVLYPEESDTVKAIFNTKGYWGAKGC